MKCKICKNNIHKVLCDNEENCINCLVEKLKVERNSRELCQCGQRKRYIDGRLRCPKLNCSHERKREMIYDK